MRSKKKRCARADVLDVWSGRFTLALSLSLSLFFSFLVPLLATMHEMTGAVVRCALDRCLETHPGTRVGPPRCTTSTRPQGRTRGRVMEVCVSGTKAGLTHRPSLVAVDEKT